MQDIYAELNKRYFEGELPGVKIKFIRKEGILACWDEIFRTIYISIETGYSRSIVTESILHEMIHIKIGMIHKHDSVFEAEYDRLGAMGAWKELHFGKASVDSVLHPAVCRME